VWAARANLLSTETKKLKTKTKEIKQTKLKKITTTNQTGVAPNLAGG
jgi:hypothetical protein